MVVSVMYDKHYSSWGLWWREANFFAAELSLFIAPLVFMPLAFLGAPGRCAYVICLMATYWLAEVMPLGVTSLLPIPLMPALCVLDIGSVAATYFDDTVAMMMESLFLALAVEESGLHKRIALGLLQLFGGKPHRLSAAFMIITSFVSMWLLDAAATALMCPIAFTIMENIMWERQRLDSVIVKPADLPSSHSTANLIEPPKKKKLDLSRLSKKDRGIIKSCMLMIAHGGLIGGTGTISGTTSNLIFRAIVQQEYPNINTGVSYSNWMVFSIPAMLLYMLASWIIVQLQFIGLDYFINIFKRETDEDRREEERVKKVINRFYDELGPWTWAEKWTLFWFSSVVLVWLFAAPQIIPGWASLWPDGMIEDACGGMLITIILFAFPRECPDLHFLRSDPQRPSRKTPAILTWEVIQDRFSWTVILLLGAGLAIAASVQASGLSSWLVCFLLSSFGSLPKLLIQVIVCIITVVVTEFATNSATASIFVPIAITMGTQLHTHPFYYAIPITISTSFSFMLPMSTPPNTIVYETGTMSMWDMVSVGILMNIACVAITVLNTNTWTYFIFDMGTYPSWAATNQTSPC